MILTALLVLVQIATLVAPWPHLVGLAVGIPAACLAPAVGAGWARAAGMLDAVLGLSQREAFVVLVRAARLGALLVLVRIAWG